MIYQVSFKVSVSDKIGATKGQITEWIQFVCGYKGCLSKHNPLSEEKFDPMWGTFKVEPLE